MNIGLVRHFKVNCIHQTFMTSDAFIDWNKQYDCSEVIENLVSLSNIKWNKCFSSDLPRAIKTAKAVFKGEIIETRKATVKRAKTFLGSIMDETEQNILIVCHGFFMYTLQKELKLLGFKGQNIHLPQNGILYLYSK